VAYQNHVLNYLAAVSVGGLAVATAGNADAVDAREADARALGKRLTDAIANGFSDPKQEAEIADNREFFKEIVIENQDLRTEEYKRWEKLGWIQ
jgi:hypothetical protein